MNIVGNGSLGQDARY